MTRQIQTALERRIVSAENLMSVVRTMKGLAAVTTAQFEEAALALQDYASNVERALTAYFSGGRGLEPRLLRQRSMKFAVVFGSDLGMVGGFNSGLADAVGSYYGDCRNQVRFLIVGERLEESFGSMGIRAYRSYRSPDSRASLKKVVTDLITDLHFSASRTEGSEVMIFYNCSAGGVVYETTRQHLLPLDQKWLAELMHTPWSSRTVPDIVFDDPDILTRLIEEFLFVNLFKTCALSVVAENSARLQYMEQAERKIEDTIEEFKGELRRSRQSRIDSELFDIIAGYVAMEDEIEAGRRVVNAKKYASDGADRPRRDPGREDCAAS
ncbi:MAG TPA: FoF1 ATP synthase subunit gamma [Candidatus Melainabacteria bacterium]|nr:FoF1 ATP synthase subunit gamma [Candidatus Melainabacteria bacterium]